MHFSYGKLGPPVAWDIVSRLAEAAQTATTADLEVLLSARPAPDAPPRQSSGGPSLRQAGACGWRSIGAETWAALLIPALPSNADRGDNGCCKLAGLDNP
jgi:hypothetical protein